ncbi:Uncharacterised protein [Mycobacteroides abscessus]|nr:Uncharacterised protein [Mycobacteroides abscessus]
MRCRPELGLSRPKPPPQSSTYIAPSGPNFESIGARNCSCGRNGLTFSTSVTPGAASGSLRSIVYILFRAHS